MSVGLLRATVVPLSLFVLLCPIDASVLRDRHAFLQRTAKRSDAAGNPANSTTIEGPDCGNVRKIFPKWEKAKQVGAVAGKARGTISGAQAIAGGLDATSAKVREAGKAFGESGVPPAAITAAADKADEVSGEVTSAVAALELKLGTFTSAVGATEMSGQDVTADQIAEVRKLTGELEAAALAAKAQEKALLTKFDQVQKNALNDSAATVRLLNNLLNSAMPLLEEVPEVAQKAKWSVNDATASVTAAETLASEIDPSKAGNQSAVVEAAKNELASKKEALATKHPDVTTAIGELESVLTALKTKLEPMKAAKQTAAGGSVVSGISEGMLAAEEAEAAVRAALQKLRGQGRQLMQRKDRLEETMKNLEERKSTFESWST